MKIWFSHGKESGPWGEKIKRLANIAEAYGYPCDSIDYTDTFDPDLRAARLLNLLKMNNDNNVLLVGSSMGGYVSLVAAEGFAVKGLFLLAPALFIPGYEAQNYRPSCPKIEVVHGWSDEVISPDHSIRFARDADCTLHLISGDHRLNTSLEQVEEIFKGFLAGFQPRDKKHR